jgi:hypothetical protein
MKILFTVVILLLLCLMAHAQSVVMNNGSGNFQSVSGDFAQNWIKNYLAKNPSPVPQVNNTSLWGWGSIPKGKALVGGKLVENYTYYQNMTSNWLGDYYLNPYTSEPINPADYPGYTIPVYSNPVYTNPYNPQQQLPLTLLYP